MKSRQRARGLPEFTLGLDGVDYAAFVDRLRDGDWASLFPNHDPAVFEDELGPPSAGAADATAYRPEQAVQR